MLLKCGRHLFMVLPFFAATEIGQAEVLAATDNGFVSQHVLLLAATPDESYKALTEQVSMWWDASHSYGGDPYAFTIHAVAGGCFCEQLSNGGSVEHMRVVTARPGVLLTLRGGLGPLQNLGVAGSMVFTFAKHEQGSELTYRYTVGGFTADGLAAFAQPVDRVQYSQLLRLQTFLGKGEALNPR